MSTLGVSSPVQVETTAAEAGAREVERAGRTPRVGDADGRSTSGTAVDVRFSSEAVTRAALERLSEIVEKLREKIASAESHPEQRLHLAIEAIEEAASRIGARVASKASAPEVQDAEQPRPRHDADEPRAAGKTLRRALKLVEREAKQLALPAPLRQLLHEALKALMRLWRAVSETVASAEDTEIQALELHLTQSASAEVELAEGERALAVVAEMELSLAFSREAGTTAFDVSGQSSVTVDVVA